MKERESFTVLALYTAYVYNAIRMVDVVTLTPPKRGKYKDWKPVIGESIPKEILRNSDEPLEKVVCIPDEEELAFLRALIALDEASQGEILNRFQNLCAKCIDGVLGDLVNTPGE